MKILFVLNTPGFVRYFDTTVEELLRRGNDVELAFVREDLRPEALEVFAARQPERVTLGQEPPRPVKRPVVIGRSPTRRDRYFKLSMNLRTVADYARYLDPRFERMEYLRNRRRVRAHESSPLMRRLGDRASLPAPIARALVKGLLLAERAIPSDRTVEAFIRSREPDVVLVSPLVTGASPQADIVKSARALGVPVGVCVASWDNLTNKGLLRVQPNRVFVWNEAQRTEAATLQGSRRSAVVVTGAQPFDRWHERRPELEREEFCERVGLRADRPFVLFAGSTSNIARDNVEEDFVRTWIEALRSSPDPLAREIGVLVRPHPDRLGDWEAVDITGLDNVTLWPPRRPNSVVREARADYFESLFHSAAVVGVNTSAMIEAAIIGRPVLTVRTPEFEQPQAGTMHFQHLLPENGGFLETAPTLERHIEQLIQLVRDPAPAHARNEAFVDHFVWPHGTRGEATQALADGIEALGRLRPRRRGVPLLLQPLRLALSVRGRTNRGRIERRDAVIEFRRELEVRIEELRHQSQKAKRLSPAKSARLAHLARVLEERADAEVEAFSMRMKERERVRKQRIDSTKARSDALLGTDRSVLRAREEAARALKPPRSKEERRREKESRTTVKSASRDPGQRGDEDDR